MPFDVFHEAVEKSLERPIFSYLFGMQEVIDLMKKELEAIDG